MSPAGFRGPIASDPDHLPFRSCLNPRSRHHLDLHALGYVEEEWFADGVADAHDADDTCIASAVPFTTRVIVRRPSRPEDCSGRVHIEALHNISETSATWNVAGRWMAQRGDAWIGVTTSAGTFAEPGSAMSGGVTHLRHVDPDRYRELHLESFTEPPPRARGDGGPVDMDALRRDLALATAHGVGAMAAIVASLRTPATPGPLAGWPLERLHASGWSQTGTFWSSFLERGFDDELLQVRDGRPAIDTYLVAVAPPPAERYERGAILVNLLSESEVAGTLVAPMAAADHADAPPTRGYEVPGSFHLWHLAYGGHFAVADHGGIRHNDRSWGLLVPALLDGIDRWSGGAAPLPREPRITRDPSAPDGIARDELGNALGGVRTAWVDVPSARYLPRCECSPVVGEMRPFDAGTLAAAHPSPSARAAAWDEAVGSMEARWLASPRRRRHAPRPPRVTSSEIASPDRAERGAATQFRCEGQPRPRTTALRPAATSTCSAPATWLAAVPRTWRTPSRMLFIPWMYASPSSPPLVFTGMLAVELDVAARR